MGSAVSSSQRFTEQHPCPVCGGHPRLPRGVGERCFGFLSEDGAYAHCTREDLAGGLAPDPDGASFSHYLKGPCRCGKMHGDPPLHDRVPQNGHRPRCVKTTRWDICDAHGTVKAVHVRKDLADGSKDMPWEKPDGSSGLDGVRVVDLPLYGVHALGNAQCVVVCEGEKSRDALDRIGITAVGTVTGAQSIPNDDSLRPLLDVETVTCWPDNDADGHSHMSRVAARLVDLGHRDVRLAAWPDAPPKGDAADFVSSGGTADGALAIIASATAVMPDDASAERETGVRVEMRTCPATPPRREPCWPTLDPAAFHGLAGDIVRAIAPHTEADDVATLATTLLLFGTACNRGPHLDVGDDRHGTNEFAALVGETSKARKGSSLATPRRIAGIADESFATERILGGLSSGEGLIWAVRDPVTRKNKKGEEEIVDQGVVDKRLLCVEEELSLLLKVIQRQGNTISETVRRAWDSRRVLASMTKNSPARVTDPHISIVAHITLDELKRTLTDTDAANGLGNRFLWFVVRRSKVLPEPGRLSDEAASQLGRRLREALAFARRSGGFCRDEAASDIWREVYGDLSDGKPGLAGALMARGEAHVLRLSLIYALLDQARSIGEPHLLAALALWEYCEASVRYIFGDATGDPIADRILSALRRNGSMAQNEVVDLFGRNVGAARLSQALETLVSAGRIRSTRVETGGRPRTVWEAVS